MTAIAALVAALVVAAHLVWVLSVLLYREARRTARLRRELDATCDYAAELAELAPDAARALSVRAELSRAMRGS